MKWTWVFVVFALLVLIHAGVGVAWSHEWYPWECCSDNDCAPLPKESVSEIKGGWKLPDGRFIPYAQARMSPDGQFHLCETKWQPNPVDRQILCFYAPIGGA
jgi:hypothetical protein